MGHNEAHQVEGGEGSFARAGACPPPGRFRGTSLRPVRPLLGHDAGHGIRCRYCSSYHHRLLLPHPISFSYFLCVFYRNDPDSCFIRFRHLGGPSLTHGRFALEDMASNSNNTNNHHRKASGLSSPSPSPSPDPSPVPSEPCNLTVRPPPALNALNVSSASSEDPPGKSSSSSINPRRTIWKCKRCAFKYEPFL